MRNTAADSTAAAREEPALPAAEDFLLRAPLYEFYPISMANRDVIQQIHYFEGPLDAFCTRCGFYSIFHRKFPNQTHYMGSDSISLEGWQDTTFACSRNNNHIMWFRMHTRQERVAGSTDAVSTLGKIGQWPTVADLHVQEVGKYRKLLGSRYGELTRAIGLASHGVGIGSFVYLRRVFESLIQEAHVKAKAAGLALPDGDFERARMDDKIELLSEYLPAFLVEHSHLYGILSKGVHALTEEECLRYFDTVRTGIELILDERLDELRKAAKVKNASLALQKVRGEIAG